MVLLLLLFSSSPGGGNWRDFRREFSGTDSPRTCVYRSYSSGGRERTIMYPASCGDGTSEGNATVIIVGRGLFVVIAGFRCLFISYWTADDMSRGVLWASPTWPDPRQCRERNRWCPGQVPQVTLNRRCSHQMCRDYVKRLYSIVLLLGNPLKGGKVVPCHPPCPWKMVKFEKIWYYLISTIACLLWFFAITVWIIVLISTLLSTRRKKPPLS